MANYASLRGPVGIKRVFLDTGGERTPRGAPRRAEGGTQFRQQRPAARPRRSPASGPATRSRPRRENCRCALRCARRSRSTTSSWCRTGRWSRRFKLTGDRRSSTGGRARNRSGRLAAAPRLERRRRSLGARPVSLRDDQPDLSRRAGAARARGRRLFRGVDGPGDRGGRARGDYNNEPEKPDTLAYLNAAREHYRATRGNRKGN